MPTTPRSTPVNLYLAQLCQEVRASLTIIHSCTELRSAGSLTMPSGSSPSTEPHA